MEQLARDSLRIVHVEDNDDFADLSIRALKRAGFEQPVVRCCDGLFALHYFSMIEPQSAPHAILLDLHMPGMNGLEVLHWVRRNYCDRDVAVYLLTSSEDPADKRRAAAEGVSDYILKSAFHERVIQKLDELIATTNEQNLGRHPPNAAA